MIWFSNLQERMGMNPFNLAFFTEVEVWADTALVPNAIDRLYRAAIACDIAVNN